MLEADMTEHLAPNRMPVPPPIAAANGRAPARFRVTRAPSATVLLAKIILAAVAIVTVAGLIATAPLTVAIPITVVLVAGLGVVALLVRDQEGQAPRPRRRRQPSTPAGQIGHSADRPAEPNEPAGGVGWGALGAASVVILVLALVAPDGLAILLATIGIAGLVVFRLAAFRGGWASRGSLRPATRLTPYDVIRDDGAPDGSEADR
jgi:hypothetical protein